MISIRQERKEDYREVENMIREAFWNLYVPGCNEHYLAHIIRDHPDYIPELDLVAVEDGKIVGSIMYTKGILKDEQGNKKDCLSFGPIAVHPDYQRKGISKLLIGESLKIIEGMEEGVIIILGHPGNYIQRGFVSCIKKKICFPGDIYPTALLVKEVKEGYLEGKKWYYYESDAFEDIDEKKVEEFDSLFEYKEKKEQPSQEEFFIYSHSMIHV